MFESRSYISSRSMQMHGAVVSDITQEKLFKAIKKYYPDAE